MSKLSPSTSNTDMFNIEDIDDTDYQTLINEAESYDTIEDMRYINGIKYDFAESDSNSDNNDSNDNKNQDTMYSLLVWVLTLLIERPLLFFKEVMLLIYMNLLIGALIIIWYLKAIEECNGRTGCLLRLIPDLVIVLPLLCIKECIAETISVLTVIVSTIVMNPILFIWFTLSYTKNLITSINLRKRITIWCTLILFSLSCIPLYTYTKPYISPFMNDVSFNFNYPGQSYTDIMHALNSLRKDNVKLWTMMEKIQEELLQQKIILHRHDEIINCIEDMVRDAIEEKLPEQIFVKSGRNGQLELSPAFMTSFQSSLFWNNFLKQNSIQVQRMTSSRVNEHLNQQRNDGTIVNKETFMKLLANALMPYRDNDEDTELNFQSLIDSALVKYHQDVLNKADFALASRGANPIVALTSFTWAPTPLWAQGLLRSIGLSSLISSPEMALAPDHHVGECWHMNEDKGTLGVSLSEQIRVRGIAIEYPSKEVIVDMSSAPKSIQVFGIENYRTKTERWMLLGEFKYDIKKDQPIQLFDTIDLPTSFKVIVVKVRSNWGNQDYTDLYRVRVHGEPIS